MIWLEKSAYRNDVHRNAELLYTGQLHRIIYFFVLFFLFSIRASSVSFITFVVLSSQCVIFCKGIKKKQLILFATLNCVYLISNMKKGSHPLFLKYSTDNWFQKRSHSICSIPESCLFLSADLYIFHHVMISIPIKVYRRFHRIND